jgi:hypothetical protein
MIRICEIDKHRVFPDALSAHGFIHLDAALGEQRFLAVAVIAAPQAES